MNYYFVDYENVKNNGLDNLSHLGCNDTVIIFYSEQCKNISLDIINNLISQKAGFNCKKIKAGTKNALDFQLSSFLGYIIGQEMCDKIYIVSKDKGYQCLCDFWSDVPIEIIESISAPSASTQTKAKNKKTEPAKKDLTTLAELKKYISANESPTEVLKVFNQYKTKQAICNGISKIFRDSEKTGNVYKKLKPLLKEKNKS